MGSHLTVTNLSGNAHRRRSKLKVNNVTIDHEQDGASNQLGKDYILVNSLTYDASSFPKYVILIWN